jgi:uncharacterized membrane protein (UPF0127 family)
VAVSFLGPMLKHPGQPWVLRNLRNQRFVATHLEQAFDSASRRKGLLGRTDLSEESALILAPCSGIHTCLMRFPIDVIFVKRNGTVARVVRELAPWRVGISPRAFAVVEVASGTAARTDTRPGDVLQLETT